MSDIPYIPEEGVGSTQHRNNTDSSNQSAAVANSSPTRRRKSSNTTDGTPTFVGRLRSASQTILEANVPGGMWSATGTAVAQAPTLPEIRKGSYGTRSDSDAGSPETPNNVRSPVDQVGKGSKPQYPRSTSKVSTGNAITEDDGLPTNVFGRPELNDQSYIPGQRTSLVGQRVPKLAVRRKDSQEAIGSEVFQDAVESQDATTIRPKVTATDSTAFVSDGDVDEDSDLDDLDPKPKRKSKNIDAMLGRTPAAVDGLDMYDLDHEPKRRSKNIDAMLGRTPEKVISTNDRESSESGTPTKPIPNEEGVYPNGYQFPKPKPWTEATLIGFKAFLRFTFTPLGFLIVLYGLNVVAWGGMLFLLLCNASPAMCQLGNGISDCNDINSPRRIWVEIDSQILNALFCVTGFGLIPWRFRDFYYLLKWRIGKSEYAFRKLAGYHKGWFRLPSSDKLPVKDFRESQDEADLDNTALPLPLKKTPSPPLTGARASPTALWKMDFVIWAFVWNTFLQAVLSGFMWGLNRYNRPSWSTGLFVAMACIVAGCGGLMQFLEGKRIKKVEGVPVEVEQEYRDVEKGLNSKKREAKNQSIPKEKVDEDNSPMTNSSMAL